MVCLRCTVCNVVCPCKCFLVCRCAVSRRYIHVCNCDMLSDVNVYLDHLKFRVVCINVLMIDGMPVVVNVMLSLMSVMSPPLLCATYRYARW